MEAGGRWLEAWPQQLELLLLVAVAGVLGGLVGFEREAARKPAGLRTHMLVAAAAALLTGLGDVLAAAFTAEQYREFVRVDPIRIVEGVVTGVAFLGAGTIFRHRDGDTVEGLTTAASLLVVAGIGIASGLRQFVLAVGVTVLVLAVLRVIRWIERRALPDDGG